MVEDQDHRAKALKLQRIPQNIDKKDPKELLLTCAAT